MTVFGALSAPAPLGPCLPQSVRGMATPSPGVPAAARARVCGVVHAEGSKVVAQKPPGLES
jgi:hypothetical protein